MSLNKQLRKKESCESFWLCEDLHEKEPHRVFTRSTIENMAKLVDKMRLGEHGHFCPPDDHNYPKVFINKHHEFPRLTWPVFYREFPIFHPDYPRWDMDERRQGPGPTRIQVPWRHPENAFVSYHSPRGNLDDWHNVVMAKYISKRDYEEDEFRALFEKHRYEDVLARERAQRRKARREKAKGKEAQRSRARVRARNRKARR